MRDIAKNIRSLRTVRNLTQDELAEKLFVTRQTISNYETGKSRPDVEMLARIAEVLETDVNTLIYGPQPAIQKSELKSLIIGTTSATLTWILFLILSPIAHEYKCRSYQIGPTMILHLCLKPLACLVTGWALLQLIGIALKRRPFHNITARRICIGLTVIITTWFLLTLWSSGAIALNGWLFENHLRGEWVDVEGINVADQAWHMLPAPIPRWLGWLNDRVFIRMHSYWPYLMCLSGGFLWLTGFPLKKENEKESC